MAEIVRIQTVGELYDLTGSCDSMHGKNFLTLNLSIKGFKDLNGETDVTRVYMFKDSSDSNIELSNIKTGKTLRFPIKPLGSAINANGNSIFSTTLNDNELFAISDQLLTSDVRVRWNIIYYGFVEYRGNNTASKLGQISISNYNASIEKCTLSDFAEKVWGKLTGDSRYITEIPTLGKNEFDSLPDNVKEWKEMMNDRSKIVHRAIEKFESSHKQGDYAIIAEEIKSTLDKVKQITESNRSSLEGLLFNKLFTGSGVNTASTGMMEGVIKIVEGLYKVSNQIGHTATNGSNPLPFNFTGEKETTKDFLFITALLIAFLSKMV